VALWKDRETGWVPIKLEKGVGAALLTITAKWKEEFTADGRSDHGNAATFIWSGMQDLQATEKEREDARKDLKSRQQESSESSKSTDVLELSIISYLVDIFMDIPSHLIERIQHWAIAAEYNAGKGKQPLLRPFESLERRLRVAIRLFATKGRKWPPDQYVYAVKQLGAFISQENEKLSDKPVVKSVALKSRLTRWKRLVEKAQAALEREQAALPSKSADAQETMIDPSDVKRLNRLVYLSVLWAVHNRLQNLKYSRLVDASKRPNLKLQESIDKLLSYTEECQEKYSGY